MNHQEAFRLNIRCPYCNALQLVAIPHHLLPHPHLRCKKLCSVPTCAKTIAYSWQIILIPEPVSSDAMPMPASQAERRLI